MEITEEVKKANAERNLKRVQLRAGTDLYNSLTKTQKENFKAKNYVILKPNGKQIPLDHLDFNKSIIFCSKEDFSNFIPYYGLLSLNNIQVPDYSFEGSRSFIETSFMIVNSREVKFSHIPQDSFYDSDRDLTIPESWNSINYVKKKLCIWRLASSVGIGDDEKMYSGCYSWIEDRYRGNKLDWIFYVGSQEQFKNEYKELATLDIPIYTIKPSSEVNNERSNIL